jgi:serine/threonine protein kinase
LDSGDKEDDILQELKDTKAKLHQAKQELDMVIQTNQEQKARIKSLLAYIRFIKGCSLPWNGLSIGIQPKDIHWHQNRTYLGQGGNKRWEVCSYTSGPDLITVAAGVTKALKTLGQYSIFIEELKIYYALVHPGVVKTYGGFIHENDHCGVFITELASGDLESYFKKAIDPGISIKLAMIGQLIDALKYIHEKGLIHGDLKSSNVLTFYSNADVISQSHPLPSSNQPTMPTTILEDLTASNALSSPASKSQDQLISSLAIPTPTLSHKHTPMLKIMDFSTMAPIPSKYDSPTVPILHAEGYHSQSTMFVRPPESMDMVAPMPSADIYGFGFVFAEILFWKSSHYNKDLVLGELKERFETELAMVIQGMLEDEVEKRWDLAKVKEGLDDYKLKHVV